MAKLVNALHSKCNDKYHKGSNPFLSISKKQLIIYFCGTHIYII